MKRKISRRKFIRSTAAATAAASARKGVLKQCADIVRKHYPEPPTW